MDLAPKKVCFVRARPRASFMSLPIGQGFAEPFPSEGVQNDPFSLLGDSTLQLRVYCIKFCSCKQSNSIDNSNFRDKIESLVSLRIISNNMLTIVR